MSCTKRCILFLITLMDENLLHLIRELQDYGSGYSKEAAVAERFIDFITSCADCCERSNLSRHLTGSAWLVDGAGERVLLTHHRRLGMWLQLGGHADGNPDLFEVATKEAYEESGIALIRPVSEKIFDIDIHRIPESRGVPEHDHYDIRYAFQVVGDETFRVSDESIDLQWVKISRISDYTEEPTMLRMAEKWLTLNSVN